MRRLISRIRFLPLTIFAATLMLTVKVSDIWQGVEGLNGQTLEVSKASAQTTDNTAPESLSPSSEGTPDVMDSGEMAMTGDVASDQVDPFSIGEDLIDMAADRIVNQDPTLLSEEEIALLQRLADRRVELDARDSEARKRGGRGWLATLDPKLFADLLRQVIPRNVDLHATVSFEDQLGALDALAAESAEDLVN